MKLTRETSAVEIGEAEASPQDFKIAASKEAFAILSSGVYNNQIGAVIRELSCNAYDAHVAAGKAHIPFDIHLPTRFEPFFSVTDHGIGMSEAQIYNLYTTYFGTNKSDSNDFIGALGIGSKSPFSYTEGFTIVSKYNGKKTTYSCWINERGTPSVQKQLELSCLDEDEPFFAQSMNNGLEVTFPVKVKDIQEFHNNAVTQLEFFNPTPTLNERIEIKKTEYVMRTANWGIRKHDKYDYTASKKVRAIQGLVAYDVGKIDESKLSREELDLLNQPLDLFFSIGELSVAASREALKNDTQTVQNIINAIKVVSHTYVLEMKKQLAEAKNHWAALSFMKKLLYSGDNPLKETLRKAERRGDFDGTYKNFTFTHTDSNHVHINELEYLNLSLNKFSASYHRSSTTEAEKTFIFNTHEVRVKRLEEIKKEKVDKSVYGTKDIEPSPNVLFVIGDIPFGAEKFIHYFLQQAPDNRNKSEFEGRVTQVYLISRSTKYVLPETVKLEALSLINKAGSPPFIYLSELKNRYWDGMKEEKVSSPSFNRGIVKFATGTYINIHGDGYEKKGWRQGWTAVSIDQNTKKFQVPLGVKKYYVRTAKGVPIDFKFDNAEQFRQFILNVYAVSEFGFNVRKENVYGIAENSQYLKEAEANPAEWIEFSKEVFDKLLKIVTPELEVKLSLLTKPVAIGIKPLYPEIKRKTSSTSLIRKFITDIEVGAQISETKATALASIIGVASELGLYKAEHTVDFAKRWYEIEEAYPLIKYYSPYTSARHETKAIIEYINLIDKKLKEEEKHKIEGAFCEWYSDLSVRTEQQIKEKTNVTIEEEPISYAIAVCSQEELCASNIG